MILVVVLKVAKWKKGPLKCQQREPFSSSEVFGLGLTLYFDSCYNVKLRKVTSMLSTSSPRHVRKPSYVYASQLYTLYGHELHLRGKASK